MDIHTTAEQRVALRELIMVCRKYRTCIQVDDKANISFLGLTITNVDGKKAIVQDKLGAKHPGELVT